MHGASRNLSFSALTQRTRTAGFLVLALCLLLNAGCNGGAQEATLDSHVKIWGSLLMPGGAVNAGNPTGLQAVAGRPISLYRVDGSGQMLGEPLATGASNKKGAFSLALPENAQFSGDLIVEADLGDDQIARAIVTDEITDITPISEYLSARLIDHPALDLRNLALAEIGKLSEFVQFLPLDPRPNLAAMLEEIAGFADIATTAKIDDIATHNPRIRLSGLLAAPSSTVAARGQQARKPVANHTVKLYRIDNRGRTASKALASTTTNANGVYTLLLPAGEKLSGNLVLRTVVRSYPLHALVVAELLNIDPSSEYVFAQVSRNLDLETDDLPIAEIREVVEYLNSLHIPETSGIVSTLRAIDNTVGSEIAFQIEMIQLLVADSTENSDRVTLGVKEQVY